MEKNIVAESVCSDGIVDVVIFICIPVFCQLLRAKYKDRFISVFIVFNDSESRESFTKTDTVSQNAAVVLFEFVDNGKRCIFLEVVELIPDFAVLKTCRFVRQYVLRYILQKLTEHVVERDEINQFRRILVISSRNVFQNNISDVLQLFFIVPKRIEDLQVPRREWSLEAVHHIVAIVAAFASNIYRRESIQRHVSCFFSSGVGNHKSGHVLAGCI